MDSEIAKRVTDKSISPAIDAQRALWWMWEIELSFI
jgi:hypothetical protein